MATVIIGAGIIGSSTAFYLSQPPSHLAPSSIHLVEASPKLFDSASGYAAGFLAKDWFSPASARLGALSFDLHRDLAKQHGGYEKWGYSSSTAYSLVGQSGEKGYAWCRDGNSRAEAAGGGAQEVENGPRWLTGRDGRRIEVISDEGTTAQVDPFRLSHFLLETSLSRGVRLHQPYAATHITPATSPTSLPTLHLASPSSSPRTLPLRRLIITAGAWTPSVFQTLFPASKLQLPITSLAGHSLLLHSPRWERGDDNPENGVSNGHRVASEAGCQAVFAADEDDGNGGQWSPEIFSRVGGDVYVAGLNDATMPLPSAVGERRIDPRQLAVVRDAAQRMLGGGGGASHGGKARDDDLEVLRQGLCFRPVTRRGTPVVARVAAETTVLALPQDASLGGGGDDWGGCWVAAGHGPWGISLSLGTGRVVAGLVGEMGDAERRAMERVVEGLGVEGR